VAVVAVAVVAVVAAAAEEEEEVLDAKGMANAVAHQHRQRSQLR
jgi:hypothetical protein